MHVIPEQKVLYIFTCAELQNIGVQYLSQETDKIFHVLGHETPAMQVDKKKFFHP